MTNEQKLELKKHIEEMISELKTTLEGLKESSKAVALDNPIGRISRIDAIGTQSINKASYKNAQAKLAKLELALKRIDDEDFGICTECDNEIPFKRLMAMPESTICVNCAK